MIKAIIFDLDDTLILERDYIHSGFKHLSNVLSQKTDKTNSELLELLFDCFDTDSTKTFNILFDKLEIAYTSEDIKKLVQEYRRHKPEIEFIDDVIKTIKELKLLGYKLGIITDGYKITQIAKLEVLDATSYFDEIIVTDDLGKEFWKPHPRSFELMRKKLNVDYEEMMYIGDNPSKDFYIKNSYPITTVRVKRKESVYINHHYLKEIYEDYSIHSISEITNLLRDELKRGVNDE